MNDLLLVTRAYAFAARVHARQFRSDNRTHALINHVCEVAELVSWADGSHAAVAAAILHDTVEDTSTTIEDIRTYFGDEVAQMVDQLTDKPEWAQLPLRDRKAIQAKHISGADSQVQIIKLADQTANISDLHRGLNQQSDGFARTYLQGARKIRDACCGIAQALETRFDNEAAQLELKLDSHTPH